MKDKCQACGSERFVEFRLGYDMLMCVQCYIDHVEANRKDGWFSVDDPEWPYMQGQKPNRPPVMP